ncbi:MAG TPA: hypothetical protein VFN94_05530, partial [Nitrospiria bacterium]|nr:hypothetical protein [Nitrospiria bacterium]
MKLAISSILCAGMTLAAVGSVAEDASLVIVSPEDGAVVESSNVPIETRFVRGTRGDHLHVYVDGVFAKTTKRETLTVWDVRDGEHTIEVRAASREKDEKGVEHKEIGVNA